MRYKVKVRSYRLTSHKIQQNKRVRIAFLSDAHNRVWDEEGRCILNLLEKNQPDLVLIGGDMIVGQKDTDVRRTADFIRQLSERYPVYYADGNHEQRIRMQPQEFGSMYEEYNKLLDKTDVVRIRNQKIRLEIKDVSLTIYGLDPERRFYNRGREETGICRELENIFGKPEKDSFTVLLAHTPRYFEEYRKWSPDLTLSGHYHGGVMLLNQKVGVIAPDYRLFSPYCCGLHGDEKSRMIVSAGLGEHTIPLRIHNPRELTIIDIEGV